MVAALQHIPYITLATGFSLSGGTTSKTLTVSGDSAVNQGLLTTDGPTFDHLHLSALAAITTIAESWIGPSSTTGIYFKGGNVGIGATPNGALDVNGANAAITGWPNLGIYTTDANAIDKGGFLALGGRYTGTSKTAFGGIVGRKENVTDGNYAGYLALCTAVYGVGLTEKVRVTSGGNVGVKTAGPDRALEINDASGNNLRLTYNDSNGSATYFADLLTTGAGYLVINTSGQRVGINRSAPLGSFDIYGGNAAGLNDTLFLTGGSAAYESGPRMVFHAFFGNDAYPTWRLAEIGAVYSSGGKAYEGSLVFNVCDGDTVTDLVEAMRIKGNGNVGVGMVPTYKFDITGNIRCSTGFGCNNATPQTAYTVNAASTDLPTVVALCNQIRLALIANGICVAA